MSTILQLAPQNVWKHFYSLTQIPRPSGHMEKITKFLIDFGKGLGLESFVDEVGNVIIRKPATPGMENRKGIILQAHMDMVPQKNNDTIHDFTTDPIETYVEGDWVKAKGTTLGADNGLGVAAIMAVLEDNNLKHGPLEALITKDEETGMYGAFGLKPGTMQGEILLNLDSEDEGELYIGCAGGLDITATLEYKEETPMADFVARKITLKGLRGGHSGLEINEGRGNANKLLARIVHDLLIEFDSQLASFEGGNTQNLTVHINLSKDFYKVSFNESQGGNVLDYSYVKSGGSVSAVQFPQAPSGLVCPHWSAAAENITADTEIYAVWAASHSYEVQSYSNYVLTEKCSVCGDVHTADLKAAFNSKTGDSNYDSSLDADSNGYINVRDHSILAKSFS